MEHCIIRMSLLGMEVLGTRGDRGECYSARMR